MNDTIWDEIKAEYIAGGISYRKLAKKHGLSETTVRRHGKAEGWPDLKTQSGRKTTAKLLEIVSDHASQAGARLYETAMKLMDKLNESVDAASEGGAIDPDTIKSYGLALRSIQQVLSSMPTEAALEEQRLRIEKLRGEAAQYSPPEETASSGLMEALSADAAGITADDDSSMLPLDEDGVTG